MGKATEKKDSRNRELLRRYQEKSGSKYIYSVDKLLLMYNISRTRLNDIRRAYKVAPRDRKSNRNVERDQNIIRAYTSMKDTSLKELASFLKVSTVTIGKIVNLYKVPKRRK